jgi:hypothetical protein
MVSWRAYERVFRSYRRAGRIVVALVLIGAIWLIALDTDQADADTVSGVVILELVTLVPLLWAVARYLRLGRLIERMLALEEGAREQVVTSMACVDERLSRLAAYAGRPQPGVGTDGARQVLEAAERATPAWRTLVIRRYDLRRLLVVETDGRTRAVLQEQVDECQVAITALEQASQQLEAVLERRAPEFAQPSLGDELRRLRQASERAASLAAIGPGGSETA